MMKKTGLVIALCLGAALLLGGCGEPSVLEEHTYAVEDPTTITSIKLDDIDVDIDISPSDDGSLYFTYHENKYEKYDINESDGILSITKNEAANGFNVIIGWWNGRNGDARLTLYLPDGYIGDLNADVVDGDIKVGGVSLSNLTITAADGDIVLDGTKIGGTAICEASDGDVTVSASANDMRLSTLDGAIVLGNPIISHKLSCHATDGDITGILNGQAADYTCIVRTHDGDSNISSGGAGAKTLEVETNDGDVVISFEGDY